MPIYAYKCSSCGHAADVLQKMSADALTECPLCGKSSFSKQVTAPSFQLKGSGWYVTDFKGEKKPAAVPAAEAKTNSDESAKSGDAANSANAAPASAAGANAESKSSATPAPATATVAVPAATTKPAAPAATA